MFSGEQNSSFKKNLLQMYIALVCFEHVRVILYPITLMITRVDFITKYYRYKRDSLDITDTRSSIPCRDEIKAESNKF